MLHPVGYNLTLIHVVLFMPDDLIIFMAFSRQQNHIAVFCHVDGAVNGFNAVADPDVRRFAACNPGFDLVQDRFRVFSSRVVAGQDDKIRIIRRYSRSPPQPNTQISLPVVDGRRLFSTFSSASGLWE